MYRVKFYTGAALVAVTEEENLEKACEIACRMESPKWKHVDPSKTQIRAEVVKSNGEIFLCVRTDRKADEVFCGAAAV